MNSDDTKRINRAANALQAYEQDAFPGKPSLLQRDQLYSQALLAALLGDLEHYANRYGINFTDAVHSSRSANTAEAAEEAVHKIGDQVRLTRHDDRCGTVVGWKDTDPGHGPAFLVEVPGVPTVYAEPAAGLTPAPPFPPTDTTLGTVTHADQAEQIYISITTRLADAPNTIRPKLEHDSQKLLSALSSWSGVPVAQLRDQLAPGAAPHPRSAQAKAAAADFPFNLNEGIPPTPKTTHDRKQPPPPPTSGPTRST